jgi:hypothetical protein
MISASKNKVRINVPEDDKSRFGFLLTQFQYLFREIEITDPEFLPDVKEYTYILSVSALSHFNLVLEILSTNGYLVQSNDKIVKDVIENVKERYQEELRQYAATIDIKKAVNKTYPNLEKAVNAGDYTDLLKILKDVTYSPDTVKKAHNNISRAVTNAIFKNIENVSKYKISVDEGIKNLLSIASDNSLKNHNCQELMLQAANVAFELCGKNSDVITTLIKISNQKNSNTIINLKAAAKFAEIALSDEKKYNTQIKYAIRELNIRWLMNIVEPFRDKLSDEENMLIDKLIDHIKNYFN